MLRANCNCLAGRDEDGSRSNCDAGGYISLTALVYTGVKESFASLEKAAAL